MYTNLPAATLKDAAAMIAYKNQQRIERGFRSLKSEHRLRPMRHYRNPRLRTHVALCMLAYHLAWHMH